MRNKKNNLILIFLHVCVCGGNPDPFYNSLFFGISSPHLWRYTAGQINDLLFLYTFICFKFRRYSSSQFLFTFLLLRCRQFNNTLTSSSFPLSCLRLSSDIKQIEKMFYSLLFLNLNSVIINFSSVII